MKMPAPLIVFMVVLAGCANGPSKEEIARAKAKEARAQQERAAAERVRQEQAQRESAAWHAAEQTDSYDGYAEYLKLYPKGPNVPEAEQRLVSHRSDKVRDVFQITNAEATEKEQFFSKGYVLGGSGFKMRPPEATIPADGHRFIIVEWTLGDFKFRGKDFSLKASEMALLAEGVEPLVGYIPRPVGTEAGVVRAWMGAGGVSHIISPGKTVGGRRLFIVEKDKSENLRLRFHGKEHPLSVRHE